MRVVVPLPKALLRAADRAARRLGVSRSKLLRRAIEAYVAKQDRDVTERLNAIYGRPGAEPDPAVLAASLEVLRRVEWEE